MPTPLLISFSSVAFTGGAAPTSHVVNTSSLTQVGDVLCAILYLGQANNHINTPPLNWTAINTVFGLENGRLYAFYKIAQVDGTEAYDFVTNVGVHGEAAIVTVRGADIANPIEDFAFYDQDNLSGNTLTVPVETLTDPHTGVMIVGCTDSASSQTWSVAPSLTQQTLAFATEVGSLVGYYDNQAASGTTPAYAATFSGPQTSGIIEAVWFRQASITLTGGFTSGGTSIPLSTTLVASGGNGPYIYSVIAGSLPPGMTLNSSTGVISGIPTTLGNYNYTAQATDSLGTTGSHPFLIVITNNPNNPPISRQPILFDRTRTSFDRETAYSNGFGAYGTIWGPFRYVRAGVTDIYFVLMPNTDVADPNCVPTSNFHVYRGTSADGFGNWDRQDVINSPACLAASGSVVAFYPASENGVISIFYPTAAGANSVIDFNCSTNTFGATSPTFSLTTFTTVFQISRGAGLFKQVSGDYWIFFARIIAPGSIALYSMKLSGGTWTGPTNLAALNAGGNSQISGSVMDPATGDMFLLVSDYASYPTGLSTKCYRVDNTGALLSTTTLPTGLADTGQMALWGTSLLATYWQVPGDGKVHAVTGTPLASPVWTDLVVDAAVYDAVNTFASWHTAFVDKDGDARVAWTFFDNTTSPNDSGIRMSQNTGSGWLTVDQVYDLVSNPPVVSGYSVDYAGAHGVHTLGAMQIADGRFIFGTAIDLIGPCFPCSGFALVTGPPPPTISILCPVNPGNLALGVPFTTAAPVVTGGTGPFTFTLLSGPSWLTIDSATGAVSGTPTSIGSFTYTIKVTDSLGATATVAAPCPLGVGGAPAGPPAPPFCIINPIPPIASSLDAFDEPLENQGS